MQENSRWIWLVLARVASYSFLGSWACALVGALLIAASGGLVGLIIDRGTIFNTLGSVAPLGALIGAFFGGVGSAVVGAISFGIVGFLSPQRHSYLPPRSILTKIFLSMSLATLGVMTSFFALIGGVAAIRQVPYTEAINDGLLIMYIAPGTMLCGQIAGVFWGFRDKQHTAPALPK